MNTIFGRAGAALAALLGAAASLHAVAAGTAMPPEKTVGKLSYVSGGVSQEEAQRFESAAREFPLVIKLYEHAGQRDEFTAGAHVTLTDRHGATVLDQTADGPFMLVRLPAGEYTLKAQLDGRSLPARHLHVTDHGHLQSVFVFPAEAGQA